MSKSFQFDVFTDFCFCLQFAGFGILGISIWTFLEQHQYLYLLLTPANSILIYFLIAAGALIIFVVIVGCCGVCYEIRPILVFVSANNRKLTGTLFLLGQSIFVFQYIFLLLLIFLIEVMVGILAFVYQENVQTELSMNLNSTMLTTYKVDPDKTAAIDYLQEKVRKKIVEKRSPNKRF